MKRLVLFPELNMTFEKQRRFGLLVRDMVQYVKFMERNELKEFCIFTYGVNDAATLVALQREGIFPAGFRVLTPPRWLGSKFGQIAYSVIGPFIHRAELKKADAFRTQQVSGSWTALIAKILCSKPLLFRLGYPLSVRFRTEGKRLNYLVARFVERLVVRNADHVAVTSRIMQRYYGAMSRQPNVTVLPNYVDLSLASPISEYNRCKPILFVGRLEPVKNIDNIIIACSRLKVPLHLYYGGGILEGHLKKLAAELGAVVEFKGSVPNEELMRIHHDHSIFMLCSLREGMPKAMIEAMASGLICVGTRTDGVSELIEHGKTGYLAGGFDSDAIEPALAVALKEMNPQIGWNAREFVIKNHTLEHAVDIELGILKKIIASAQAADRLSSAETGKSRESNGRPTN
jgi:glycosyltransferase involved in cell wall biosynthesis